MAILGALSRKSSSVARSVREAGRKPSDTPKADKPKPGQTYSVKEGDSLWKIAKGAYGDGSRWRDIAEANPGAVGREGKIHPGTKLRIPGGGEDRVVEKKEARPNVTGGPGSRSSSSSEQSPPPKSDPALQGTVSDQRQQDNQSGLRRFERDVDLKSGGGKNIRDDTRMRDLSRTSTARTFDRKNGWLDEKKDVADEAQKERKASSSVVARATVAHRGQGVQDEVYRTTANRQLGRNGAAEAEAYALRGGAEYAASAGVDVKNKQVTADVSGRLEGKLAGAGASATSGEYGNDKIHGETAVHGEVFVGAEATGNARVAVDRRGAEASAGVDAFVGAKARADVRQSVGVLGEDIGSVGARGEVYAGVGAKANGSVGFRDGRFKVSGELGAALGVGAGVGVNVDVDVMGGLRAGKRAANAAGDAISDGVDSVKQLFSW